MKIYLSGPMTGRPQHNFPEFRRYAAMLREDGHTVVSPAEMEGEAKFGDESQIGWEVDDALYEQMLARDHDAQADTEAIAFIPGWQNSGGAGREGLHALELGHAMYIVDIEGVLFPLPRVVFLKLHRTERLRPEEVVA